MHKTPRTRAYHTQVVIILVIGISNYILVSKEVFILLKNLKTNRVDKYYSCTGSDLILYRFQPCFSEFIYKCYANKDFMQHYRLYQRSYKDSGELRKELLKVQSLPPELLKSIEWVIYNNSTQSPIGLAGLVNFNSHNEHAELLIGLLDSDKSKKTFWG